MSRYLRRLSIPLPCSLEHINTADGNGWCHPLPTPHSLITSIIEQNDDIALSNAKLEPEQDMAAGIESLVSQNVTPCYFLLVTVPLLAACSKKTDITDACLASIRNFEYNKENSIIVWVGREVRISFSLAHCRQQHRWIIDSTKNKAADHL